MATSSPYRQNSIGGLDNSPAGQNSLAQTSTSAADCVAPSNRQAPSSWTSAPHSPPVHVNSSGGDSSSSPSASQGYPSMTGASYDLQKATGDVPVHAPGRAPTGGQSHSHRPVSAMPTPSTRNYYTPTRQATQIDASSANNTVASMTSASYADRRASAHPTVPHTSSSQPHSMMTPSDAALFNVAAQGVPPISSPAAVQYFAAHPRRQQVHFGNYLLLQTLGEGEFGKVKLGVHKEWGEEVAVKLIKRDKVGTADGQLQITGPPSKDPSKMSKVEKEIRVLKDVRHPNIVRLYEVIESDRYIGIVLEYASGGELFDHILAHKYLKERDACRLFAQLISGVSYLHQKKIVHRDLKLENLLLDRNRNVIITDFGFANNFENRRDDLMATSCGSPCYAAPELVVQDGLYAGSAVDVWSCGVILYAMLAGYLPFDDDPANPDGDNINLLYKYIMATPLSFPDYITAHPRDLLSRMLVPDPLKRADLTTVMSHSWLAPYRDLFKFTVEELERAAIEQQNKKRQVYRQQMAMQQEMQEQQRMGAEGRMQGHTSDVHAHASVKQQRHQSAMASSSAVPDRMYSPSTSGASRSRPVTGMPTPPSAGVGNARVDVRDDAVSPSQLANASPQSANGVRSSQPHDTSLSAPVAKRSAGSKAQRHTVQLEYDSSNVSASRRSRAVEEPPMSSLPTLESGTALSSLLPASSPAPLPVNVAPDESIVESDTIRPVNAPTTRSEATPVVIQVPAVPVPVASGGIASSASRRTSVQARTSKASSDDPSAPASQQDRRRSAVSRVASNPASPERDIEFPPGRGVPQGTTATGRADRATSDRTPEKRPSDAAPSPPRQSVVSKDERAQTRHRKGMSTDKFLLSKLLGTPLANSSPTTSNEVLQQISNNSTPASDRTAVLTAAVEVPSSSESPVGRRNSSKRRKAMSLVVGRPAAISAGEKERENATAAKGERRLTGRLRKETLTTKDQSHPETPKRSLSTTTSKPSPSAASVITTNSTVKSSIFKRSNNGPTAPFDHSLNESTSTVGASSNAAKKVMDWFRKKSISRGQLEEKPPLDSFAVKSHSPAVRRKEEIDRNLTPTTPTSRGPSDGTTNSIDASLPSLIVTPEENAALQAASQGGELDSVPSSRSTSGTHSQTSQATHSTDVTTATEVSSNLPASKSSASTVQVTPRASTAHVNIGTQNGSSEESSGNRNQRSRQPPAVVSEASLRIHQGAVDQSALTSRPPADVFEQVQRALWQMGIEAKKDGEEECKLECIRRKRAKTLMSATQNLGLSIRTSVFPPSQADYERSSNVSSTSVPTNNAAARIPTSPSSTLSPSSASMRNFLRRGSSQHGGGGGGSSAGDHTTSVSEEPIPAPLYGEPSVDGGQEVRFSVEVTRLKNLPGLYSVDIRRMKGNLWAYKFIYHALLDRCDLSGTVGSARSAAQ